MAELVLASLWWLWTLAARSIPGWPKLHAAQPEPTFHALTMVTGFLPLFMAGFLLTAGPRWLRVTPPRSADWLPPGIIATGAASALYLAQALGSAAVVRLAAGIYGMAWLWLAAIFAALLFTSHERDRVHAALLLVLYALGAAIVMGFALAGTGAHAWVAQAGVWCFLAPTFVTVCHRLLPFFVHDPADATTPPVLGPWWVLAAMAGAPLAHGALAVSGLGSATWFVDLPAAVLVFALVLAARRGRRGWSRLLTMLQVGFIWYGIALALAGADALLQRMGPPWREAGLGLAALHAAAIGFCVSVLMAMVTRITHARSGRTLAADTLTWRLFWVLQGAVLARLAVTLGAPSRWLFIAIALWCASLLPWCVRNAPLYWSARPDGRPG